MNQDLNNSIVGPGRPGVAERGLAGVGRDGALARWLGGTCGGHRRSTVMIMVVAMLSMLFVIGTAFLATVTFEGAAIEGAKRQKTRDAVVDNISREVRQALKDSMLGTDGLPFNQDATAGGGMPSAIGNDTYGEIPGVHPLLAAVEPYDPDGFGVGVGVPAQFFVTSDLESAIGGTAIASPPLFVDLALSVPPMFDESSEGDPASGNWYRRDADGDGVWDSYEYKLDSRRYPPSVRGDLAEKLRDPEFVADPGAGQSEDDLFYSVRVIPHGAMVNVNYAHTTLLDAVFGLARRPQNINLSESYSPENEEALLRNRFVLPPRELPLTSLQSRPVFDEGMTQISGDIAEVLYGRSFVDNDVADEFLLGSDGAPTPQWWLTDTSDADQPTGDIQSKWLPRFDTTNYGDVDLMTYDFRHLMTTVSYDDQLMRGVQLGGDDWLSSIDCSISFAIDDWPEVCDSAEANATNGRIKVSLPGVVDKILRPVGMPYFADPAIPGSTGTFDDNPLGALTAAGFSPLARDQFVRTIQDGFLLMLSNVGSLSTPEQAQTAAALTANLIDFADRDDVPTAVAARTSMDGSETTRVFYGLERQPFITELYFRDNGGATESAVELYNPYNVAIQLGTYKLADQGGPSNSLGTSTLVPTALSGSIGPNQYAVFRNGNFTQGTVLPGAWSFNTTSNVALLRTVNDQAGSPVDIVVDRFDLRSPGVSPNQFGVIGMGAMVSLPRSSDPWKFVVPMANEVSGHSMGGPNFSGSSSDIRPVEINFANTGNMATAYPTTGTMLLLSRFANSTTAAFNETLADTIPTQSNTPPPNMSQFIDNGRMPIFTYSPDTVAVREGNGPTALNIPWGQLVFDYFTALPLDNPRTDPMDMTPKIDMNGLRVHGRIDINSAPWTVLAGLPYVPMNDLPAPFRQKIRGIVHPNPPPDVNVNVDPQPIRGALAQSIVAYREARSFGSTGDFSGGVNAMTGDRLREKGATPEFTGFLSVGELANVRRVGGTGFAPQFDIDSGVNDGTSAEDYVLAVAKLVALGDWVTVRSDVFTVYGTVRGAGQKEAVDQRAIRFQETVDRLPSVLDPQKLPRYIGRRIIGSYAEAGE